MQKTIIELVRHAKAQPRERWWGRPDRERPLTEPGEAQAAALASQLSSEGDPIAALYSSPWDRCWQTLEPLARALDLRTVHVDPLGEVDTLPVHDDGDAWVTSAWLGGRAAARIAQMVVEHAGDRVVACSHGDVIPAALALIAGRDDLPLTDVSCRKAGRFTLVFDDVRCVDATYHPPPS